jgi:hypothetical protein
MRFACSSVGPTLGISARLDPWGSRIQRTSPPRCSDAAARSHAARRNWGAKERECECVAVSPAHQQSPTRLGDLSVGSLVRSRRRAVSRTPRSTEKPASSLSCFDSAATSPWMTVRSALAMPIVPSARVAPVAAADGQVHPASCLRAAGSPAPHSAAALLRIVAILATIASQ